MKVIQPSYMKTASYKRLMKELGKPPKVRVTSLEQTPEDKKKAKMMQKLMNYMFKTNSNDFTKKYYAYMRRYQKQWVRDEVMGFHERTTAMNNVIEAIKKG